MAPSSTSDHLTTTTVTYSTTVQPSRQWHQKLQENLQQHGTLNIANWQNYRDTSTLTTVHPVSLMTAHITRNPYNTHLFKFGKCDRHNIENTTTVEQTSGNHWFNNYKQTYNKHSTLLNIGTFDHDNRQTYNNRRTNISNDVRSVFYNQRNQDNDAIDNHDNAQTNRYYRYWLLKAAFIFREK